MNIETALFLIPLISGTRRVEADEERALVTRIAGKDDQALAALYDRYETILYSVTLAVVKKPEEAEDVLQEIFLLVWNKAATFDTSQDSVYAWLVTLARNRAIDRLRSRSYKAAQQEVAEPTPDISSTTDMDTPLEAVIMMERAEMVMNALGEIPDEQRQVIEMAYFEGYTQTEMADRLNVPLGTVKTRIRQGMKKLHTLLMGKV